MSIYEEMSKNIIEYVNIDENKLFDLNSPVVRNFIFEMIMDYKKIADKLEKKNEILIKGINALINSVDMIEEHRENYHLDKIILTLNTYDNEKIELVNNIKNAQENISKENYIKINNMLEVIKES